MEWGQSTAPQCHLKNGARTPHPDPHDPRARPPPPPPEPLRGARKAVGQGGGPSQWNVSKQEAAPSAGGRGLPVLRGGASLRKCTPFPTTSPRPYCLPGLPITPTPADSTRRRRTQGLPTTSLGHLFSPGSQSPQAHSLPVCPGPTPPVLLVGPSPRPPGPAPTPLQDRPQGPAVPSRVVACPPAPLAPC